MKFKTGYLPQSREGEEKIVKKFIWTPTCFNDNLERVWLEFADVVYKVKKIYLGERIFDCRRWVWMPDRFATQEDYTKLPFEKSYEDVYDWFEKTVRSPLLWLMLDFLIILIVLFNLKEAVTILLFFKMVQCYIMVTFRDRSNEV